VYQFHSIDILQGEVAPMTIPIELEGAGAMEIVCEDMSNLKFWYEGMNEEPRLLRLNKAHPRVLHAEFQGLGPRLHEYMQNAEHSAIWSPLNKLLTSTVLLSLAWS
jgi:hypothetical protein